MGMVHARRGLVLAEVAALIGVAGAGIALLAVADPGARARQTLCLTRMKLISQSNMSYSTDYQDRVPSFSWRAGQVNTPHVDLAEVLQGPQPSAAYGAGQATALLRAIEKDASVAMPREWLPHVRYTHLVIQSYLALDPSDEMFVCPDDRPLLDQRKPGAAPPQTDLSAEQARFVRHGASYEVTASTFDLLQSRTPPAGAGKPTPIRQGANERTFLVAENAVLQQARYSDVMFPSGKAMWYESRARHAERGTPGWQIFSDHEGAVTVALADGWVKLFNGKDMARGWDPAAPGSALGTVMLDEPAGWERPDDAPPLANPRSWGRLRWTRMGVRGTDIGMPEVDSGQGRDANVPDRPEGDPPSAGATERALRR